MAPVAAGGIGHSCKREPSSSSCPDSGPNWQQWPERAVRPNSVFLPVLIRVVAWPFGRMAATFLVIRCATSIEWYTGRAFLETTPVALPDWRLTHPRTCIMTRRKDPVLTGASKAKCRPYFLLSVAAAMVWIVALETAWNSLGIAEAQVLSTQEGDSLVYMAVEVMPQPIGGLGALASQIKIPDTAWEAGVEGKVFLDIVVDEQGNVSDAKVLRGLGAGLDEEALRVVRQAKFMPGRQGGQPVKVRMTLPLLFKFSESSEPAEPSDSLAGDPAPPGFRFVEQKPELIGGHLELLSLITYPESAREARIQGDVIVLLEVDEQGNVVNPKIAQGIGGGCDEEALRVVSLAKFIPGQDKGMPVRTRMRVTIQFRLN